MARYDVTGRDNITPDPYLTQISVDFELATSYVGSELFPRVNVVRQSAKYRIFPSSAFSVNFAGDSRAPGARANEITGKAEVSEDQYYATEHALEEFIPDEEDTVTEDPFDADEDSVEDLTNRILLGKELAIRDMVYDQTAYKTNHVVTLGAGEHFDEYSTSNPITVFRDAFRTFHNTLGIVPNLGMIPWSTMSYLEDHPDIVERYSNSDGAITAEQIASILGLGRIIVPGGIHNSETNPGQAAALSDIWTDNIVLAYVPDSPGLRVPAFGYEFLWGIPGAGRSGEDNTSVDQRRDDDRIGHFNRVRRRYDLKFVGVDQDLAGDPVISGFLIRDTLASE